MIRWLILLLTLSPVMAQMPQGGVTFVAAAAGATPAIATLHSGSSSGTFAVGARTHTTCVANAYCTSLPFKSVSGDTIVVYYTYMSTSTTAHAPTVTDDKSGGSSTYTCVTEGNDANVTTRTFVGACYSFNVAANIRVLTVTFPVATNTQVAAISKLLYNVVTGDTLSATNGTQTAATTFTSGSITTTVNGDFVCNFTVGTNTRRNLTTKYTVGAGGLSMRANDTFDAKALQCGVQASSGAIQPTMTGQSNKYAALTISFKAGSSGTAPTGMYIITEQHQSTDIGTSGNFTVEMPSAGANLLVSSNGGGGTGPMLVTAISDGTNTWKASAPSVNNASSNQSSLFYAENATGSATLSLTITTSGTGDCSFFTYAIAGAATSAFVAHEDQCDGNGFGYCNSSALPTSANVSPFVNTGVFNPGNTSGIVIATMQQGENTSIGATSPTGALFEADTAGGEVINGPYPIDENNAWANLPNTDNSSETWTFTQSFSATTASSASQVDSFAASGATLKPAMALTINCNAGTSGTTVSCPFTPHHAGAVIVIMAIDNSSTGHNITFTESGQSNTIVKCSGATCGTATDACVTNSTTGSCMKFWYVTSVASTATDTLAFTWSASNTFRSVWISELSGVTTFDLSSIGNAAPSGGFVTSPSITTTGTNELLVGWVSSSSTTTPDTSASGGTMARSDQNGNLVASRVETSSGAKTMRFTSAANNQIGIIGFK